MSPVIDLAALFAWVHGGNGFPATQYLDGTGQFSTPPSSETLASGVYTPTLANTTNIDSSTATECQYLQVGATVFVAGAVLVDATAAGAVLLGISLPVASNFGDQQDCGGTAFCPNLAALGAAIQGDATNNRAQLEFIAVDTTERRLCFTFGYQVI